MTTLRVPWLVLAIVLAGAAPGWSQQGTSQIQGRVVDAQSAVLPGATVVIRNQATGTFRETVSNADGSYFISGVLPGAYTISVDMQGFRKFERRDLQLEVGRTVTLDVTMDVGSLQESVNVTAESPLIDVTSKEVGGNISSHELTELPSPTRNFISFIGLLPGVVANVDPTTFGGDNVSVNGQDARNNNYALDGGNNNDDFVGQRGGMQARPPLETIQEFQVMTSQFDAEFGRTSGAVINAVMKQGSNRLRGSAFTFLQDSALTEKDYFAKKNNLSKPDTKEQQFGGTIGGPIIQNKLHYFGSVERVLIDNGVTVNIPARPEFNKTTAVHDRVWNTVIRADHQINADHTWGVRWLRDSTPQLNKARPDRTFVEQENDVDQTFVGTLSSVLANTRINTMRLTYTRENVKFANPGYADNGGHQELLPPQLNMLTFFDGQASAASSRLDQAWQLVDTFSWFKPGWHGDHDVKFGFQYEYARTFFTNDGNLNGTFTFRTDQPFNANDPRTYPERLSIRVPSRQADTLRAHYTSLFAQDSWKVGTRLNLNLGVRYDLEVMPIDESDNVYFSDPHDYPIDMNNIQPRLGFTYDISGNGRSIVRGGAGRFYDTTYFELISAVVTSGVYSRSFTQNFPANAADPGPSNGQLPTNEFLVNGPVVNRALLDAMFPPGTETKNTGTVTLDNPDRKVPYLDQFTVGYQRQLWTNAAVSADYIHDRGRDQLMNIDLNPGLRVDTTRTGRVVRVDPNYVTSVLQRNNVGETTYDGIQLQFDKRYSQGYSARVSYTAGYIRGNTSAVGTPSSSFQLLGDMRLDLNEGPGDNDRRHLLTVSGTVLVPKLHGVTASGVMRYMSGLPFTILDTNTDPDRNGILFDPLPAGDYTGTGSDAFSTHNDGGRNGARGPDFFQLDTRVGYKFRLGSDRTLDVFAEVFNLTNHTNFATPSGDRRGTDFLVLTAVRTGAIPRTAQFGARYGF
jgi:carboxypeptidase family protein/TonB-dependent receptor-like protein